MYLKDSHCSFCGSPFEPEQSWPRHCGHCGNTSYRNPLPVAVTLLPVDDGLLVIRRAIPPHQGRLALPGGFIDYGESWQAACARELYEESGVRVAPESIELVTVRSAPDGTVLIFGKAPKLSEADLARFESNSEVLERLIIRSPQPLAFPLHSEVVELFFALA
jgi:ADP-ribose pyrophosphatase